jgi:murein tripeptide amidase MpaA
VTKLLDERTVYVIPRANPDGAELAFTLRGYEIPYKPYAGDAAGRPERARARAAT